MSTSSTTAVRQGISLAIRAHPCGRRHERERRRTDVYAELRNSWLIHRASARSRIIVYFPDLYACWYSYERAVADYLSLGSGDRSTARVAQRSSEYVDADFATSYVDAGHPRRLRAAGRPAGGRPDAFRRSSKHAIKWNGLTFPTENTASGTTTCRRRRGADHRHGADRQHDRGDTGQGLQPRHLVSSRPGGRARGGGNPPATLPRGSRWRSRSELPAGTVTFLSSRVAGGESSAARRTQHEQAVAPALDEHGGVEVERGGGSVLGVFASSGRGGRGGDRPDRRLAARQRHARRASHRRGDARRQRLSGPGGRARGPGRATAAAEGQVLLTAATAALVEHGLGDPASGSRRSAAACCRGSTGPSRCSSCGSASRRRRFTPASGRSSSATASSRRSLALADAARGGDGVVVAIEGTAGIGKTRLLAEARTHARRRPARAHRARRRARGRVRLRRRAAALRVAARDGAAPSSAPSCSRVPPRSPSRCSTPRTS